MVDTNDIVTPEKKALTYDELEHLPLVCVICGNPLPEKRARARKDTCSSECQVVRKAFNKHNVLRRHCPNCYHPSTPQERAEFRQWRKDRGDRRSVRGRPKREGRDILISAMNYLIEHRSPGNDLEDASAVAIISILLYKKVDAQAGDGSTLPANT
jgi:hypothetical protein